MACVFICFQIQIVTVAEMATDYYNTEQEEHRTYCNIGRKFEFIAVEIKTDICHAFWEIFTTM